MENLGLCGEKRPQKKSTFSISRFVCYNLGSRGEELVAQRILKLMMVGEIRKSIGFVTSPSRALLAKGEISATKRRKNESREKKRSQKENPD